MTRLPGRRLELLVMLLLTASAAGIIWANREAEAAGIIATTFLELLLPIVPAIVAAGLLAGDPALSLLLSVRRSARRTLLVRLVALLGAGAAAALAVQALVHLLGVPLSRGALESVLVWFAPILFFCGVATAVALLRGRPLDGIAAALTAWALSLFSLPFLDAACVHDTCRQALVSPVLTLLRPHHPAWLVNRSILIVAGLLFIAFALWLTRSEERLIAASTRS